MFNGGSRSGSLGNRKMTRLQEKMDMVRAKADRFEGVGDWFGPTTSGNHAFDDYRAEDVEAPRGGAAGSSRISLAKLRLRPRSLLFNQLRGRAARPSF